MSLWPTRPIYRGISRDSAQFAAFADGSESHISIRAYDCISEQSTVILMSPDQAVAFARALLDAAIKLREEIEA